MTLDPIVRYLLNREPGLERTNPVHLARRLLGELTPHFAAAPNRTAYRFSLLLRRLEREGLRLPRFFLDELRRCGCLEDDGPAAEPPGVVGLLADLNGGPGLVLPLHFERADVPLAPGLRDKVVREIAAGHRHLGQFAEAERTGRRLYDEVRSRGEDVSLDEEADAAVEYVASFFDGHRFRHLVAALTPWGVAHHGQSASL